MEQSFLNQAMSSDGAQTLLQVLFGSAAMRRTFAPGARLLEENGGPERLHLLTKGWAYRSATTREGGRQITAILLPGDFCNLDCFSLVRSDNQVRALTPVITLSVSRARMLELSERQPDLLHLFLNRISTENAMLGRWVVCLGRKTAEARLAHLLCELAVRLSGAAASDTVTFDLPLTQEQLADVLGLTNVHVNRVLQRMRSSGLIETRGKVATIQSLAALSRVAGFAADYLHQTEFANATARAYPRATAASVGNQAGARL